MAIDANCRGHSIPEVSGFKGTSCSGRALVSSQACAVDERSNCSQLADAVTRCRRFFPRHGFAPRSGLALRSFTSVHHPVTTSQGGCTMRYISLTMGTVISTAALLATGPLYAQNANDWAMPAKDYANTRFSTLKQINSGNVGKLQVAWTLSN